jgi:hypothetical protein
MGFFGGTAPSSKTYYQSLLQSLISGASHLFLFSGPLQSLNDQSGKGATLTRTGTTLTSQGLSFNGISDYATISPVPTLGSQFTIYALIDNIQNNPFGNAQTYLGIRPSTGGNYNVALLMRDNEASVNFSGTTIYIPTAINGANNINPQQIRTGFQLVTLRYDGAHLQILINGEVQKSIPQTGTPTVGSTPIFTIGALLQNGGGGYYDFENIVIAALAVYPTAWHNDATVQANANMLGLLTGQTVWPTLPPGLRDSSDPYAPFMYLSSGVFPENQWVEYRTTISYTSGAYPVQLAASGEARLYVNGQLAIASCGRSNYFTVAPRQVDISPYLVSGTNVLVIEHYQQGRHLDQYKRKIDLPYAGVMLYDMATGNANSGTAWKCRVAPEYTAHSWMRSDTPSTPGFDQMNHCIVYNLANWTNIHSTSYDASSWANAVVVVFDQSQCRVCQPNWATSYFLNTYTPVSAQVGSSTDPGDSAYPTWSPCPMAQRIATETCALNGSGATVSYNASTNTVSMQSGASDAFATLDFGAFRYGTISLTITCPAGTTGELDVAMSENRADATGHADPTTLYAPMGADRILLSPGTFTVRLGFAAYAPRGGRCLLLRARGTGGATITIVPIIEHASYVQNTGYVPTISDTTMQGYLTISQNVLTAHLQDVRLDHSVRDDGQFIQDACACSKADHWLGGSNPYRKILLDQSRDIFYTNTNCFSNCPPDLGADAGAKIDWSFFFVYNLYDEYWWTGNVATLQSHWDALYRFISQIPNQGTYLTAAALTAAGYVWYGEPSGTHPLDMLIINARFVTTLQRAVYIAQTLGQSAVAQAWSTWAQSIITAIQGWRTPSSGPVPAHPVCPSAAGGLSTFSFPGVMMSLVAGAIPSGDIAPLISYLAPTSIPIPPSGGDDWNIWSHLYEWPVAVKQNGGNPYPWLDAVLAPFVAVGYLIENRLVGVFPMTATSTNTKSHAWTGSGFAGFVEGVLGISIVAPGGGIAFNPVLGLPNLNFTLNSPVGIFNVQKSGTTWTVTAPTGGTMQVAIAGNSTMTLNAGQTITLTEV